MFGFKDPARLIDGDLELVLVEEYKGNPDNTASARTCELAGGELVEIVDLPKDTDMYRKGEPQKCRYKIEL